MFDGAGKLCHRSRVRRLIALFVMLTFVGATAAPAMTVCRMRAAQKECCCKPARADSICAPDCCDTVKPPHLIAQVTTLLRGIVFLATPALDLWFSAARDARALSPTTAGARVGLHERAPPRLPLRI